MRWPSVPKGTRSRPDGSTGDCGPHLHHASGTLGVPKVYETKLGIGTFSSKNTIAHDDVTEPATARKILRNFNGLPTRIELTL